MVSILNIFLADLTWVWIIYTTLWRFVELCGFFAVQDVPGILQRSYGILEPSLVAYKLLYIEIYIYIDI